MVEEEEQARNEEDETIDAEVSWAAAEEDQPPDTTSDQP